MNVVAYGRVRVLPSNSRLLPELPLKTGALCTRAKSSGPSHFIVCRLQAYGGSRCASGPRAYIIRGLSYSRFFGCTTAKLDITLFSLRPAHERQLRRQEAALGEPLSTGADFFVFIISTCVQIIVFFP